MPLFDLQALNHHRTRAKPLFDAKLFIHAAQQLRDRLEPIRVPFHHALDITPAHTGGLFPFFQDRFSAEQWTHLSNPGSHALTSPNGSFDLVLSALEAHWIDQVPLFLQNLYKLLKPGGLFLCTFWGGETLKELRHALFHAENLCHRRASPRVIPMLSLEESVRLLQNTGFTLPVADQENLTVLYPSLDRLFQHLRAMGERNALSNRRPLSRALVREAESFYLETYGTSDQKLPATFQLLTLTGWTPSSDQPQPLKRGSASHSLSEVLSS